MCLPAALGDKLLWVGRSPLEWEQGLLQLPLVQGVLISSPASQRFPVEAVKVLAMQKNLLFSLPLHSSQLP